MTSEFEVQCSLRYIPSSLLRSCPTLHTLRLCNCSLGPAGARALSRAIGPTLRRLELDQNALSDSQLEAQPEPEPESEPEQRRAPLERHGSQLYEQRLLDHSSSNRRLDGMEADWFESDEFEEAAENGWRGRVAWEQVARAKDEDERKKRLAERPLVWARDRDLTGVVALARRLREQQRESGVMMQLTASENRFGDGAAAALGQYTRAAAQALPTSSWLERRRRDRKAAAAAASSSAGNVLAGSGSSEWASKGELSTSQSNIWRDDSTAVSTARRPGPEPI